MYCLLIVAIINHVVVSNIYHWLTHGDQTIVVSNHYWLSLTTLSLAFAVYCLVVVGDYCWFTVDQRTSQPILNLPKCIMVRICWQLSVTDWLLLLTNHYPFTFPSHHWCPTTVGQSGWVGDCACWLFIIVVVGAGAGCWCCHSWSLTTEAVEFWGCWIIINRR